MSQLESAGGPIVTTPTKLSELTELSQFPAYYVESDMLTKLETYKQNLHRKL